MLGLLSKLPVVGKWFSVLSIGTKFKKAYDEFEEAEEIRKEAVEDRILTADEAADYLIEMIDVFETLLPKYSKIVEPCDGFLKALKESVDIEYNMDTKKITKVEFEG